jgi:dUTPase
LKEKVICPGYKNLFSNYVILKIGGIIMKDEQVLIEVAIELCHKEAKIPVYARADDAGMDIYAVEDTLIAPGQTVIVRTGLKVAIPAGF